MEISKRKICLLGEFKRRDEGLSNIDYYLSAELSKRIKILELVTREIFSDIFWKKIKGFKPDVIHYLHGPSLKSFFITKAIGAYCRSKTVISATHPIVPHFLKQMVRILKPDLILIQSDRVNRMFRDLGCKTEFLPNGVDITRFTSVDREKKIKLRLKFGIDPEKFIVLHVGHLTKERNLGVLNLIQGDNIQVIVVVSGYFQKDFNLYNSLRYGGCLILDGFFENIEEIYGLADCYIFPVKKGDSIQSPLSVMEAMACNLPVVATEFEGLASLFNEGDGLFFARKEKDFLSALEIIKKGEIIVKTRDKILPYSWEKVGEKLEKIYYEL
ncbi:MAG: glycosyltransferase family 4 protein [Candidatus Margulisbacteria bacterium]|nr:glycosyltransferase family 4 protein [Candidatus Margulisiibacteriota bacterium]